MNERRKNGTRFTPQEMNGILYGGLNGLNYYNEQGYSHGDFNPLYMAVDNGNYRIINRQDYPFQTKQNMFIQKNKLLGKQNLYCSPMVYQNLKNGNTNFNYDPRKEDCYALGLTMLEAGTGESIQNIYNPQTGIV